MELKSKQVSANGWYNISMSVLFISLLTMEVLILIFALVSATLDAMIILIIILVIGCSAILIILRYTTRKQEQAILRENTKLFDKYRDEVIHILKDPVEGDIVIGMLREIIFGPNITNNERTNTK